VNGNSKVRDKGKISEGGKLDITSEKKKRERKEKLRSNEGDHKIRRGRGEKKRRKTQKKNVDGGLARSVQVETR